MFWLHSGDPLFHLVSAELEIALISRRRTLRVGHDAAVAGLRTALGAARLRNWWEAGGAMTADDAVALATEQDE